MARREDIEQLSSVAEESEDLPTLEQTHQQFQQMIQSLQLNVQGTKDEDVVNLLNELLGQAQYADQELKQKIASIRVDMLDPSYAARKAERERAKASEQTKADELTQRIQQGIGGLFGGLSSALGLGGAAAGTAPAPAAAASHCGKCGAAVGGTVKFCPECGSPIAHEKRCAKCSATLDASARFCPECGMKAV